MTTYLVSCPDCGSRIEVDRQTMRAATASYCPDCGHDRELHVREQFTRKAYCGMWGCNCYLKVSRPVPDKGTRSAAHMPAGNNRGGFPVGSPPVPACSVSGEPPHTRRET